MKKIAAALMAVGISLLVAAPAGASDDKVTICHRTNSDKNPYVLITVSENAVNGQGNNDHTNHVVDDNHSRADIIPAPFTTADLNGDNDENDNGEKIYFCPGGENTGPQGPAGPTGPAGSNGADGENGEDGANGTNGTDGVNGENGKDGNGLAGPAGNNGANGAAGSNGISGSNGVDGKNGADGVTTQYVGCSDGTVVGLGAKCPTGETVVTPPATSPGLVELPRTGSGTLVLALAGALLGFLGLALRTIVRRCTA